MAVEKKLLTATGWKSWTRFTPATRAFVYVFTNGNGKHVCTHTFVVCVPGAIHKAFFFFFFSSPLPPLFSSSWHVYEAFSASRTMPALAMAISTYIRMGCCVLTAPSGQCGSSTSQLFIFQERRCEARDNPKRKLLCLYIHVFYVYLSVNLRHVCVRLEILENSGCVQSAIGHAFFLSSFFIRKVITYE